MALIRFFREVLPETGELAHDFTDPDWNTRFLGDLYQDLSEEARKRYALLQTPDFVESWILDRTLEPAIREFGHERVTMIDPACGSGHFLLGGFARLLRRVAAFRAWAAAGGTGAACAGCHRGRGPQSFRCRDRAVSSAGGGTAGSRCASSDGSAGFRVCILRQATACCTGGISSVTSWVVPKKGFGECCAITTLRRIRPNLDRILGRQYHAVVGNPPYITPKDAAMRDAYRDIYTSCHRKYGLGAPFIERFFDLGAGRDGRGAGGFRWADRSEQLHEA